MLQASHAQASLPSTTNTTTHTTTHSNGTTGYNSINQ